MVAGSISWYQAKKTPKKWLGWGLRALVILLTAVAGLIPLVAQLYPMAIKPGWSTFVLAVAGLCLAFDKFAGYTSGWIRFMQSELDLARRRDAFLFEWQAARLAWNGQRPSREQAQAMLAQASKFVEEVHGLVAKETQAWASDVQAAIRETDGAARSRP